MRLVWKQRRRRGERNERCEEKSKGKGENDERGNGVEEEREEWREV